jgi:type IV secretory pathway VirB10-like protein
MLRETLDSGGFHFVTTTYQHHQQFFGSQTYNYHHQDTLVLDLRPRPFFQNILTNYPSGTMASKSKSKSKKQKQTQPPEEEAEPTPAQTKQTAPVPTESTTTPDTTLTSTQRKREKRKAAKAAEAAAIAAAEAEDAIIKVAIEDARQQQFVNPTRVGRELINRDNNTTNRRLPPLDHQGALPPLGLEDEYCMQEEPYSDND